MSILLIFTVYRLCPVNLNSQTNWFYSLFLRIPGIPLIFFMICSFISARWEWAEVELRGDTEPSLLWQNVSYRLEFHILLFLSMSSLPPVLCFALLHVLLNNTGAGTEQGAGFLISAIPLLIVMQSLSADIQYQHMSCQQMIFQLLLKQIYENKL